MRVLLRFVLASAVAVFVILAGVLGALILSALALPDAPEGARRAAGDGFLVLEFLAIAVLVSVPVALAAAYWIFLRAANNSNQVPSQPSKPLFLNINFAQ